MQARYFKASGGMSGGKTINDETGNSIELPIFVLVHCKLNFTLLPALWRYMSCHHGGWRFEHINVLNTGKIVKNHKSSQNCCPQTCVLHFFYYLCKWTKLIERCQLNAYNTKKKNSEQMPGAVDEDLEPDNIRNNLRNSICYFTREKWKQNCLCSRSQ